MSTSWKNPKSLNISLTLQTLINKPSPITGKKNLITSKKCSLSKPSDLIKSFPPSKTGSLTKWVKDSSYRPLLILPNATRTQPFRLLWSLCSLLVQIQLPTFWGLLSNLVWAKEFSQFPSVKVRVKRRTLWPSTTRKKEDGCCFKTATWPLVGCQISKNWSKNSTITCTKILDSG